MALQDVFLSPLGLLALLAAVPVVLLYLIQPDPRRVELPTIRFLLDERREDASNPLFERIKRSLLLLLQLLVIVGLAASLAGPYVDVSRSQTVEETVLVVDGSASMATESGGATRFARAVAAARKSTSGTNSVVFAGGDTRVVLRDGGPSEVAATLDGLSVTGAPGELGAAISQAAAIAGEGARVVVLSDFAGGSGWVDAVRSARARGLVVELRQFAGGGAGNVGIVDRSFSGGNVTLSVKNYGEESVTRTLTLGDRRREVDLEPGAVERVTLAVPAGGGRATLAPGDSFPVDDVAYLSAPAEPTVDVLLLTNDRDRYLATALSVIDQVRLTVDAPPTTVDDDYDVIVYSDTNPGRLLRGSVEAGRDVVEGGGGVAFVAQRDPPDAYGDLLLVEPSGVGTNPSVGQVATDELTRDLDFPPPEAYLAGSLRSGRALVSTPDGSPLLATESRGPGRVLYYGYLPEGDTFRYYYQYPVFWKRAVFYLAGRESPPSLNRPAGARLQFDDPTRVETPRGAVSARTIPLDRVGYYGVGDRRVGVSLFSEPESDVVAEPLGERADEAGAVARDAESRVPQPLAWVVSLAALAVAVGEVAFLRRRGDL